MIFVKLAKLGILSYLYKTLGIFMLLSPQINLVLSQNIGIMQNKKCKVVFAILSRMAAFFDRRDKMIEAKLSFYKLLPVFHSSSDINPVNI